VQLFKNKSIFVLQLELQQLPYKLAPADDVLQKVGVLAMLDKEYLLLQQSDEEKIESLLANKAAHQLVLQKTADPTQPYLLIDYDLDASMTGEATLVRQPLQGLTQQASMAEVHSLLDEQKGGVVYIFDSQKPEHLLGLIRWEQVRALLTKQNNLI
jgi:CIC family chloride channel protein